MTRPTVRCRCGHRVLAKEVLRTDLYERQSGREYVYVKYRCKRCKRLGETFVAESRWDWRIFEAARTEMSEAESDSFATQSPISSGDILEFHCHLSTVASARDLAALKNYDQTQIGSDEATSTLSSPTPSTPALSGAKPAREVSKREPKNPESKIESKIEPKAKPGESGSIDEARRPPRDS